MRAVVLGVLLILSVPAVAMDQTIENKLYPQQGFERQAGQIETTRAKLRLKRLRIIEQNLPLQQSQWQSFWGAYGEYMIAMEKLDDQVWRLITDYAQAHNADQLSDEMALNLLKRQQQIEQDRLTLRSRYTGRYLQVISPRQLARFYQLENRMDALLSISMAQQIPLIH